MEMKTFGYSSIWVQNVNRLTRALNFLVYTIVNELVDVRVFM